MSLYRIRFRTEVVVHGNDADDAMAIAEAVTPFDGVAIKLESIGPVTRYSDLPVGITGDHFAVSGWEYKDLPEGKQPISYYLEQAA